MADDFKLKGDRAKRLREADRLFARYCRKLAPGTPAYHVTGGGGSFPASIVGTREFIEAALSWTPDTYRAAKA